MNERICGWTRVCTRDQLVPDRGSAVLVDGEQVALFALGDGQLFAVSHKDPVTGANVMAHGLIGSVGGTVTLASPLHKEVYELSTGRGLGEGCGSLHTWEVRQDDQGIWLKTPQPTGDRPVGWNSASPAPKCG